MLNDRIDALVKKLVPLIFRIIFYSYLLIVTLFLLLPLPAGGEPLINDKVAHTLIFLTLAVLIHRAYPQFKFMKTHAPILALYGFCIEVIQGMSGYRTFSMLDFAADVFGILLYAMVAVLMYKIFRIQAPNG